jgi:chemotaxis protein MotB
MKKKLFLINNMKKNSPIKVVLISFVMLLSACVPQRKYQELTNKFDVLKTQNDTLKANLESADQKNQLLTKRSEEIEKEFFRVKTDLEETEALYAKVRKSYEQLESNYKKIIDASANSQADLMSQLKELERKLQKREEELDAKEALISKNTTANTNLMQELMVLDKAIKAREAKVLELQRLLSQKDSATNRLKKTLSESLFSYKNNGITVRQEGGKVYVSLEEGLLFQSGRTDVDKAGKDALLKLCETLRNENDFDIVVEGHTDDVPIKTAKFEDNWDLSVLRSTSVLRIMVNDGKIDPLKIIPSGRGEYQPIDVAKTKEARAKNRRIEIILTPNLGEVLKILEK